MRLQADLDVPVSLYELWFVFADASECMYIHISHANGNNNNIGKTSVHLVLTYYDLQILVSRGLKTTDHYLLAGTKGFGAVYD